MFVFCGAKEGKEALHRQDENFELNIILIYKPIQQHNLYDTRVICIVHTILYYEFTYDDFYKFTLLYINGNLGQIQQFYKMYNNKNIYCFITTIHFYFIYVTKLQTTYIHYRIVIIKIINAYIYYKYSLYIDIGPFCYSGYIAIKYTA